MKKIKLVQLILLASVSFRALAQKLPGIQKNSLRAPAKVKVDGKATEWGNKFQAYNKAIQVFYTVANDDKRLYLVVQTDKREIINKIINGGVSFSINQNDKKTIADAITVTYPVYSRNNRAVINFSNLSDALADAVNTIRRDSVMRICNNSLEEKAKYIRTNNLPDVDTLLSIYNVDGIKAKSGFNDKLVYTVELGIDLKLLNIDAANLNRFSYNIRLNAVALDYVPGFEITRDAAGNYAGMSIDSKIANVYLGTARYDTDCWGQYTLVK